MTRTLFIGALALLAAAPLPAQGRRDRDEDISSRIDTVLAFGRNGTVDLSLVSGEIIVNSWDQSQVRIQATSERGRLRLDASSSRIQLDVRSQRGKMGDTRYEVSVPVGTRVVANATSGDITVRGTKAELDAHSVSGNVEVADAADRITIESVSGDVSARTLNGNVRASSVSGDVELEGVSGELEAESVSGDVTLDGVQSKYVRVETVSGEVRYDGSADAGGRYEFNSHSGDVRLALPASLGATFTVETFSGEIESDFPITLAPGGTVQNRPRRFEFVFGNGAARIDAETFSGDIILERTGSGRED